MVNLITSTIGTIGTGSGSGSTQMRCPYDVFPLGNFLYVVDYTNDRIQRWSKNGTGTPAIVDIGGFSMDFFMFIDKYNNLYLCTTDENEIVRFAAGSSTYETVAGTGTTGSTDRQLDRAQGLFVDDDLTLFIADQNNHRIQMWFDGSTTGITVAGTGQAGSDLSELDTPSAVAVDDYAFIYVADSRNHRIVRWTVSATSGVCVVGCSTGSGNAVYQLNWPANLAFDTNGSLYVNDYYNYRIQKFEIINKQREYLQFFRLISFSFPIFQSQSSRQLRIQQQC